jgi:hypothetical protein
LALFLIAGALSLLYGCASTPPANTENRPPVQVYEWNPYVGKPYTVVGRLWTGTWRTAFWVPTYPNKDDAIAAMQTEAARRNADALISVNCLDQRGSTWFQGDKAAYLCYGVAIQLPPKQG